MKMNQAKLEKTKNENLEAAKRLGALAITLAKMGFTLLKKLPWAKIGKITLMVITPVFMLLAEMIQRMAENAVDVIADGDLFNTEEEKEQNNWRSRIDVDDEIIYSNDTSLPVAG